MDAVSVAGIGALLTLMGATITHPGVGLPRVRVVIGDSLVYLGLAACTAAFAWWLFL